MLIQYKHIIYLINHLERKTGHNLCMKCLLSLKNTKNKFLYMQTSKSFSIPATVNLNIVVHLINRVRSNRFVYTPYQVVFTTDYTCYDILLEIFK